MYGKFAPILITVAVLLTISAVKSSSVAVHGEKQASRIIASTNHRFGFLLPRQFGTFDASTAGCCEYGTIPLPVTTDRPKPSFLGLGAHMSGTGYLSDLLALHPSLQPPSAFRELFLFSTWPITLFSFDQYLKDMGKPLGKNTKLYEISASYLHVPGAACRIQAVLPNIKLVVVLRDPVERALAHYDIALQLHKQGKRPPPRPLLQTVQAELDALRKVKCSFEGHEEPGKSWNDCYKCWYLVLEEELRTQACEGEAFDAGTTPCSPLIRSSMFVQFGMYAPQIAWWLNFFLPDRFLFINYEALLQDSTDVANRISQFVGVNPSFSEEQIMSSGLVEDHALHEVDLEDPDVQKAVNLLRQFYRPHVEDLYAMFRMLKVDFGDFTNFRKQVQNTAQTTVMAES